MPDVGSTHVLSPKEFRHAERQHDESVHGLPRTRTLPVSEYSLRENRVIAASLGDERADLFRILRRQVLQALEKEGHRTLAITSPTAGAGKSLIAANLAVSLAMDVNQTTLLVDLDLRNPTIHRYFGIRPDYGLGDYLASGIDLSDCFVRLSKFDRLAILPSQGHHPHSSEIISSPRMRNLAAELRERYEDRIILYDLPPLLATDDALGFLPQAEAILLVIEDGKTQQSELDSALELLSGTNVIGTVLNKSTRPFPAG